MYGKEYAFGLSLAAALLEAFLNILRRFLSRLKLSVLRELSGFGKAISIPP